MKSSPITPILAFWWMEEHVDILTDVTRLNMVQNCQDADAAQSAVRASVSWNWTWVGPLVVSTPVVIPFFKVTVQAPVWVCRQMQFTVLLYMVNFLKLERASFALESSFQVTVSQLVSLFVSLIERYVLTVFTAMDKEVVLPIYMEPELLKVSFSSSA